MSSDPELIQKAKQGDLMAFKELVLRHEGKVAGIVRSMLGITPEAEDVGQEVFIRFYEALSKFRGDAAVSTYVTRIAINLSLNEISKRKRTATMFGTYDAGDDVAAQDEKMDVREMIDYELGLLDPDFRAVVTLRLIEGYSTEETSKILQLPLGTVLSRLSRAQQKLKAGLSKYLKP